MKRRNQFIGLLSAVLWAACGAHSITNGTSASTSAAGDATTAKVTGFAIASNDGQPLPNVKVSIAEKAAMTASDGSFTLNGIPTADRAVLRFTKEGYADAFTTTPLTVAGAVNVTGQSPPPPTPRPARRQRQR